MSSYFKSFLSVLGGYLENKNSKPVESTSLALTETKSLKTPPISAEPDSTTVDWFKTYQSLYRKEIEDWMQARQSRYNIVMPLTVQLQQLYKDAMVDLFLRRQVNNRVLRVSNKMILIKDKTGKIDTVRSASVQTKVIRTFIKRAAESKFYGYSMLFIKEWEKGRIIKVIDIPRENIVPEKGLLLRDAFLLSSGIRYTDYPNFLIYMQLEDPIGYLENIAPLTILKRHSWSSWDEFEQIFGIPLRVAKTMVDTEKHRNDLEYWMQTMGQASYAILPKTVDIDIKQSKTTDSFNVFNEKRKAVNEEIAIGINGQTMTTMNGSSRSQSETHLKTQDEITAEDIADVKDWFNDEFIPVLRNLGYDIPEGYYVDLISSKDIAPQEKIKIDQVLLTAGYKLDKDYVQETYNVVLDKDNPTGDPVNPALSFFAQVPQFS